MALIREGSALRTHGDLLAKPAGLFFAGRQLIRIKNQRRKHYYQNEVSYTQYQKENRNEGEAAATAEIEERMVMQNCIQNLNPMDQRIFWGRAYGFSYKELSGFCKKSEQALQCQYSRAIKKLQGMMSQEISLTRA